jgi:hypothetical protein
MSPAYEADTLAARLAARGLDPAPLLAFRNTLDRRDADAHWRTIADLEASDHVRVYERMQDGRAFPHEAQVLCFVGEPGGLARFVGFRRFFARRPGVAPGDIVYDPDLAHLLHNFISRARRPMFYDSVDIPGLDDLIGFRIQWPRPLMIRKRPATHPGLRSAPASGMQNKS